MKKIFGFLCLGGLMLLLSCGFDDVDPGLSFQEQLEVDIELIDSYLAENEIEAEVDASGIRYVHNIVGAGASPVVGDVVVVKYNGAFLDGTFYGEDSIGLTLTLDDRIIGAFQIVIPLMKVGGIVTMYSPSGYCFGKSNYGIPANSNFIFEVELVAIIKSPEDQLIADQNIIDEFLEESDLSAEIHASGIRFIIEAEGVGNNPLTTSNVTVKYKGTFLNGQIFDQSTSGVQFFLGGVIEAWKEMVPTMKVGGKLKIYCPSVYCYGPSGSSSIAPNTILVFEIELISIN